MNEGLTVSVQELPWKINKLSAQNDLHTMCSYMAMFPPGLPHYFIKEYSKEKDIVLDPFCGRGTTVLEACKLGRRGVGNDLNPLAYVLAKAKSNVPSKNKVIERINELKEKMDGTVINLSEIPADISMLFNDITLGQLVFMKEHLDWQCRSIDTFITAMILGILHGKSETYLSLSMPNTFSMSPNYIRKYVAEHQLKTPQRDVFDLLLKKLDRIHEQPKIRGKVYKQDAKRMTRIKESSIDLIITSPPYTRVISYGQFNWIRLWFLDKKGKEVDKDLFFTESLPRYTGFMRDVLGEFKRVLKPDATAVLVIGDVQRRNKKSIDNLAQHVWEEAASPQGFELKEPILEDVISSDTKVSKIWGEKKGNATKVDRILILKNNK